MPKMRTIEEAAKHIRAVDPATCLTQTALRRLVVTGVLPCVKVGVKYLLDLDTLEDFLAGVQQNVGMDQPSA